MPYRQLKKYRILKVKLKNFENRIKKCKEEKSVHFLKARGRDQDLDSDPNRDHKIQMSINNFVITEGASTNCLESVKPCRFNETAGNSDNFLSDFKNQIFDRYRDSHIRNTKVKSSSIIFIKMSLRCEWV